MESRATLEPRFFDDPLAAGDFSQAALSLGSGA